MAETTLVRVQEKGQVTLPADVRRRLGIQKGDLVSVTETPDGVVITPQKVIALKALDEIGRILREQGVTLEELMESGREIRGQLLTEMYGIEPDGSE
ncbi:MAG: AbrB/MazE/SpoVT family DNA-binding domain-containing protein [Thermomicrobiales bacterium]|nr:AbrB/MazE/SpoVT family DNA-binding domain-containing protein [Thermomicrobiales bacterium]